MLRRPRIPQRVLAGCTAVAVTVTQLITPPTAEATHLGAMLASAGSAPPPAATLIESFQPDLFTGRATTSIPIVLPPGRQGVQPNLALSYASSSRNGVVGVGWNLALGAVERLTKPGVPTYTSTDTFLLQFQGISMELVPTSSTGTYQAKDEGLFLRIKSNGTDGWEVRDKAGTRYLFGGTPDSEQTTATGVFRWALRKVADPNGNFFTVTYTKEDNQLYPAQLRYTGHDSGLAPSNLVEFEWEGRTDVETSARSGALVTTAKRLKAITVTAAGQFVRKYELVYRSSPRTGRSLLESVTQIGSDRTSKLPAVTFAYQSDTESTYTKVTNEGLRGSNLWNVRFAGKDWGDENGAILWPSQIRSWGETSQAYTQPSGRFGGFSWDIDRQGNIQVGADRDMNIYFWTYVFLSSDKTLTLTPTSNEDSQLRFFINGDFISTGYPPSLTLRKGWNLIEITSYNQNAGFSWNLNWPIATQVDIVNPAQFIQPALTGDFNGDGLTDVALFDQPSGTWKVSTAFCACNFHVDTVWMTNFGTTETAPILGDWNGDGKTDIATYQGGRWQFATSNGSSFQRASLLDLSFGGGTPLIGDFNGDGVIDLATYTNGAWAVALGSRSGFRAAGSFTLAWGSGSDEPLTGDFNGDGVTDIGLANRSTGDVTVALSVGTKFELQPSPWRTGFGAGQEHLIADFNGDGLSDVAYYDRGSGQAIYAPSTGRGFAQPKTVGVSFAMRDANDQVQVGDFNGDGLADPAVFDPITGSGELAISAGQMVDLLVGVNNGVGGTLTLGYVPSSQLDNTGDDDIPDLPFVVPVLSKTTLADGLGNTVTTDYAYQDGRYDPREKEFRGFRTVRTTDAEGTTTQFIFHQDEKKGRLHQATVTDKQGNRYSEQTNAWACRSLSSGAQFCGLSRQVTTTFDGNSTSRSAAVSYEYDDAGNVKTITEEGETAVSGDERTTRVTYAMNPAEWIMNRPATITVFGPDGQAKLKEQRFYYDEHPSLTDPPAKGNLTGVSEWLNTDGTYLATTLAYDPYGNVLKITDPRQHATTLTYETASHTFPETITNALGHTQRFQHDARFGTTTRSTDPNEVTTQVVYDAFGRQTKLIGPDDSEQQPAVEVEYNLSITPVRVTTRLRERSGSPAVLTSHTFFDGLGRPIQVRSPSEKASEHIVSGVVSFDARGLPAFEWLPYAESPNDRYVAPSTTQPRVAYGYDPVRRVVRVVDPDGTASSLRYDDWTVTAIDANGHQTRSTADAYGRTITVEEFTGSDGRHPLYPAQPYQLYATTRYRYDPLDNLTTVTDTAGNVTTAGYDSLSRQTRLEDPDAGRREYRYDAVDNLIQQTDARGVITAIQPDALNRPKQITYTVNQGLDIPNPGSASYTYDDSAVPFGKGRLTSVEDPQGKSAFGYDKFGRVTTQTQTIDGAAYTFKGEFDLLARATRLTYPDGETLSYTYNTQGGLETVTGQPANGQTGSTIFVSNIDYNAADLPTTVALGNDVTTTYDYDPKMLRLSSLVSRHPSRGTLQQFSDYAYDGVGNITKLNDLAAGELQTFRYDEQDRLTQASGPYGPLGFSYDALGNLTGKGALTLRYDKIDGQKPHAVTSSSDGTIFAYDRNGNLLSKQSSAAAATVSQLTATQFQFDAANQLTRVDRPLRQTQTVTFQQGWNFFSLPVVPDDPSVRAVFPTFGTEFDQLSRYNPATHQFESYVGDPKFDDFSTLDYGRGYEVYCTKAGGASVTLTGVVPSRSPSFTLASGSQLIGSTALETKPISWLLTGLSPGTDYDTVQRFNPSNGALEPATEAKPGEAYFLHALRPQAWNPPLPTDSSATFAYDADGTRIKKTSGSGSTRYVGDLYEIEGVRTTKYIFAGGARIAAKSSTGELRFFHTDHLGSTNVVTDATGAPQARLAYAPFGELVKPPTPLPVSHTFTGQRLDPETGLHFYNARYYDSSIGRFISPDPIVQNPFNPPSLNRFSYVQNDPINQTDPTGLCPQCIEIVILIIIVAGTILTWPHAPESNLPSGPIEPTRFDSLAPPQLPTSFPPGTQPLLRFFESPSGVQLLQGPLTAGLSGVGDAEIPPWVAEVTLSILDKLLLAMTVADLARLGVVGVVSISGLAKESTSVTGIIKFGQESVRSTFSHGPFAGQTIGEVAAELRAGRISPDQLPVNIIVRDGERVTLNNRSLLALRRAKMEPTIIRNRTGIPNFERLLERHLGGQRPSDVIRVRGGRPNSSLIR